MARRLNGNKINLQEAVALLIHNQAAFVTEMAEINRRYCELIAENRRVFAAIDRRFLEIERILNELPEAIRQKIGFKTK